MSWRLLLFSVTVVATGCASGDWEVGLPDDGPLPQGSVPNGVVLVTGPASWQEAAQQAAVAWDELLPDGIEFDSAEPEELAGMHPMMSQPPPAWEGAVLRPGHVELDISPAGLHLDIDVTMEPVEVSLTQEGLPECLIEVEVFEGRLEGTLALTQSKLGVVNLSPLSAAAFREGDAEVTLTACHDAYHAMSGTAEGPEALALGALASAAFDALAPSVASALPAQLGLNLAGAMTQSFNDGSLGEGSQHMVVRAPMDSPAPWWQLAAGRLVVPYSVGVSVESHPCAPAVDLPVAMSSAVPTVDSDWSLLVNQDLVARQLLALWSSGGLCGDRLGSESTWEVSQWLDAWPELDNVAPETSLNVRVWPGSAPSFSFNSGGDGVGVEVSVEAGEWEIELMGWRDGARVRLSTLRASISLVADVEVREDGAVGLIPGQTSVEILASTPGLLSPPDTENGALMVETMVRDAVESSPLRGMLSLPTGLQPVIELHGAYIVIRDA